MEFGNLEQCVKNLNEAVNEFPIGAVSLDDYKPIEKKIQTARESLMRLNARLLMLKARYKRMSFMFDGMHSSRVDLKSLLLFYRVYGRWRIEGD